MAKVRPETAEVNARILYWGLEGAGKRTVLQNVATKLRPDHRGELTEVPTRFDPSESYTVLPIELGEIGGTRTRIELVAVPGSPQHAPTRKQLLDEVDGVVLVVDSREERIEENAQLLEELQKGLADYARRLDEIPLVVQYNKRDLSNAYVIDELHRRLGLGAATVFETVASEGTGVLQALSTISKKVIRALREESLGRPVTPLVPRETPPPESALGPQPELAADSPLEGPEAEPRRAAAEPVRPDPDPISRLENAILHEDEGAAEALAQVETTEAVLDTSWGDAAGEPTGVRLSPELSIVSVGRAQRVDAHSVSVPLVLGDPEGGTSTLRLTIRLDAVRDGGSD